MTIPRVELRPPAEPDLCGVETGSCLMAGPLLPGGAPRNGRCEIVNRTDSAKHRLLRLLLVPKFLEGLTGGLVPGIHFEELA